MFRQCTHGHICIVNEVQKRSCALQVLVKNVSTSVNPVDFKIRTAGKIDTSLPRILGGDVAGIVEEADEDGKVLEEE